MSVLRLLLAITVAAAVVLLGLPPIISARTWCASELSIPVCNPMFSGLMGGVVFLAFYLALRELDTVVKQFKAARKAKDGDAHVASVMVGPDREHRATWRSPEPEVRSVLYAMLAKLLLLAGPLIIGYMIGVDWLFGYLARSLAFEAEDWLVSLTTVIGLFLILGAILGADLRKLSQRGPGDDADA